MSSSRIILALLTFVIPVSAARAVDVPMLYKKVVRSSVYIIDAQGASGSGSIVDLEQRILITNYHVVQDKEWVFLQFPVFDEKGKMITDKTKYIELLRQEKGYKADVLKTDKKRDLAIIKLQKAPPPGTVALPLASEEPPRGAKIWNIGSPGAVDQVFSITEGTVRGIGPDKFTTGGVGISFTLECRLITSTNATNPGDSGGPVVNAKGELVGVTQGLRPNVRLVSYSVDVSEVKAFLKENKITVKADPIDLSGKDADPVIAKKDNPDPKKDPKVDVPGKKEPTAADEKAAQGDLRLAQILARNEEARDKYIDKLREIIKKYPGTMGAKEAQRLLNGLRN